MPRGPKPKKGVTMTTQSYRVTPKIKTWVNAAGTVDFWRANMESIAIYTIQFEDNLIDRATFAAKVGEAVAQAAEEDKKAKAANMTAVYPVTIQEAKDETT
jgi:hypothetical protein